MSKWGGRLAAPVLGAPPALAFPRPGLWWLALVGLVPVLLLAMTAPGGREAAVRAWLGGTGFFLAVNAFLVPKVGPFMVPLAMLLALLWLPLGWLARTLLGGRARPTPARLAAALALLPSGLVAGEAIRSWEGLGGPWGLLGASQWNAPALLAVAALGGVWGLSFLLVAVNVAVAAAVGPGVPATTRAAAVLVAAALPGAAVAWWAVRPAPPPAGTVRVAFVQPGVVGPVEARFRAGEALSRTLPRGSRPDLVVWGESSVGRDPDADPDDLARLAAVARAAGGPVLAGVDARRGGGGIYKSALLVGPEGRLGSYDKLRLVPFGEYVPLRPLLGWVTRLTDAAVVDRRRGSRLAVLPAGAVRVGPLVCFESAFPDLARNLAAAGADLVVVQTADTTFQRSWGPDQHASLSAVRAVEAGRPVVQAALSGTSAAFDARGRRLAWAPASWRGAAVVELPLSRERTPYVRTGDWLPVACWLALAAGALAGAGRARVRRGGSGRRTGSRPRSMPARPRP
ncbi:MAG TPA: apolipoprotein N-acyltransferase [Actinomycetes bacterium]|nr:apolipoprotein N-acyltransferase [Actinomycetes bacterium]